MKSSAACRLCGATFDEDESSIASTSFPEADHAIRHCHCLSSSSREFEKTDGASFPSTSASTTCDLCERLRGRTGGSNASSDVSAIWTRDSHAADHQSPRRKRDENDLSACDSAEPIVGRRDRTLRCDRTPIRESSARCASSVVRWIFAVRFYSDLKSAEWRRLFWIVLLMLAVPDLAAAKENKTADDKGIVCESIDIRNSVDQFHPKLNNCRVVEGFVQILLIDRAEPSDFANISFPKLVEITGYLILYRVSGLKSVGHLFPNLAVIRGNSLFINYALVAFEMMNLQEIGLHSLTNILRGFVRFEKNPTLCYVDTIDWDIIAKAGKGGHVIMDNKPTNGCPVCDKKCPTRQMKHDQTLCWNRHHCQRICQDCGDRACNDKGECCHPSCLGGCTGSTINDCVVCRNIIDGEQCKDSCPNNTYVFMNRRCFTKKNCFEKKKPQEARDTVKLYPYKLFNDSCVMECPAGYMENETTRTCQKCNGQWCMKECSAANVDSIASAQKLRGCTNIAGSLEIQIRGGKNIVKELEDNLNMIEEIDGYLKIVRSFPLISLNFLKNLRVIHGNELENGKYSLAVFDNQNLQELWDWNTHSNITILAHNGAAKAKLFFHFNPKLCLHEIEKLREKAQLDEFTDHDVASTSNGDKVACNVTELKTKVTKKTPRGAIIEWRAFTHHDTRSLLGYVVYFIEAPNQNITMYDGRDACGGDGWRVEDVSAESTTPQPQNSSEPVYHTHILTLLKPYTQYAYYVKTYTIATERSGAQSKVKYFTTLPDAPSPPRALSTWSNSSSELVISWFPPLHKNGNLTHYRIIGRWEPDDANFIDQRNYCDEPMPLPKPKLPGEVIAEEEKKHTELEKEIAKSDSCACSDRETTDQSAREKEVSSSIAFENALHNQVYIKRINIRRRRHTSEMLIAAEEAKNFTHNQVKFQDSGIFNDKVVNDTYLVFDRLVPSTSLTFVMRNLRHFAAYNIEVQACRERVANETNKSKNCSTKSMKTHRTLAMESADNIPLNTFDLKVNGENSSLTIITLRWEEPPQPNGLIVTYQIEYKRIDIKNIKATVACITRRDFVNMGNSYVLKDLPAGNYSVKIRATSLAGNGAYTEVQYFYVREHGAFSTSWIFFWSILGVVIIFTFLMAFYILKKRSMRNVPSMRLIATVNPEYVSTSYVPDEWEVPRKKIQLLRELGNGSFGMVYEGLAKDVVKGKPEVRCAVKTVNENATDRERIEFLNEASVMKAFNTHHVVRLLGVVSQGQPTLVVMELMVNGDLKTYLRSHRPDVCENSKQPPTLRDILQMAVEIADGMSYLAAKKFVHRDLAARNCMVAEDLTVKIGDFGMTRDIYETDYYRKGSKGLLPVRWMAPESLKDGVFTSFSDVWSYGVVLWEMVTLASQPYQGLSNDQVLRYVIEGGVMERPENCPDSLYNLMRRTWNHRATRRPTFIDIETLLLQEVSIEGFENVSFYHSPEGIEARNQNNSHSPQNDQDLEMVALQDLREEETEGEEDSPLRQDFGDFASFEPCSIKNNLSSRYAIGSYGETSKATSNFHDMNSIKVPKAGFDEFGGVSGDSLVSSKDTLNSPFVEGSLKSVRSSPFIFKKSTSRSNISQSSLGKPGSPPGSLVKRSFLDSPNPSKFRDDPDYENRSPEIMSSIEKKEITSLHVEFPSMDVIDIQINGDKKESNKHMSDYMNKSETLNNGYIGNTAT